MQRPGSMELMGRLAKIIGIALLVVGVLVAVAGASFPGNCAQTGTNCGPTGSNWPAQADWSVLFGKVLATLGLGALALGALLKMRYSLGFPASGKRDEVVFTISDRWFNGILFLVTVFLLFELLMSMAAPGIGIP
ncbi:MAG: hypothetical protein ACYDFT_04130 [Thermoplasmata archaeon]